MVRVFAKAAAALVALAIIVCPALAQPEGSKGTPSASTLRRSGPPVGGAGISPEQRGNASKDVPMPDGSKGKSQGPSQRNDKSRK
jgi:hypothetical protein